MSLGGATRPRSGWCQRICAPAPLRASLTASILGLRIEREFPPDKRGTPFGFRPDAPARIVLHVLGVAAKWFLPARLSKVCTLSPASE
jgi:hypothetical protein